MDCILYIAAIMVPVVNAAGIAETSSNFFAAPIFPRRSLPTKQSPRIVLNGNQRIYRADARIGKMTPAPILNDAIRMLLRVPFAPAFVLSPSRQTRNRKDAKRTDRHTHCGSSCSHDASPIDSVQCWLDVHLTLANAIRRSPDFWRYVVAGFREV
jgi:hypothetical protein